jgi:RimJ/RimL family protein N-acetyltransferase
MELLPDAAPPAVIPRIRTARLLLRELRESDFDAFAQNLADPVAAEFLSGTVDRRTAFRIFLGSFGFWTLRGAGWWAVELLETGEFVGSVGAFYRERPSDLELGWTIVRRFWRRGFASEAAAAALWFGTEQLAATRVVAHIDAKNIPSVRVAEGLGMTYEGEVDFFGERVGRYASVRVPQ